MANKNGVRNGPGPDPRAKEFVAARQSCRTLESYPGALPETLEDAYRIQNDAIELWPTPIVGWKVGRITGDASTQYGTDRLSGPIFQERSVRASGEVMNVPAFAGGFAAVEAECVLIVREDADADKLDWTVDEARELVGAAHLGIEIASSPFPDINAAGALVTISDFGNNYGLILGEEIADWQTFPLADWHMETLIADTIVGSATAMSVPGGPLESFRFLLENTARRGLPLKRGMLISTGAVTGVHEAQIGQTSIVRMSGLPDISIRLVAAMPAA